MFTWDLLVWKSSLNSKMAKTRRKTLDYGWTSPIKFRQYWKIIFVKVLWLHILFVRSFYVVVNLIHSSTVNEWFTPFYYRCCCISISWMTSFKRVYCAAKMWKINSSKRFIILRRKTLISKWQLELTRKF